MLAFRAEWDHIEGNSDLHFNPVSEKNIMNPPNRQSDTHTHRERERERERERPRAKAKSP